MTTAKQVTPEQIEVPQEMVDACYGAWIRSVSGSNNGLQKGLAAALAWWANNPRVPSEEEPLPPLAYQTGSADWKPGEEEVKRAEAYRQGLIRCLAEWQRRMFLRKELALPDAVKGLMFINIGNGLGASLACDRDKANESIRKAYEIGKAEGAE